MKKKCDGCLFGDKCYSKGGVCGYYSPIYAEDEDLMIERQIQGLYKEYVAAWMEYERGDQN